MKKRQRRFPRRNKRQQTHQKPANTRTQYQIGKENPRKLDLVSKWGGLVVNLARLLLNIFSGDDGGNPPL